MMQWTDGLAVLAQAGADAPEARTLLDYVREGGLVGYVLITLSFVALALIIRNAIVLRVSRLMPPGVVHGLEQLLRDNDIPGAQAFCNSKLNDSFLTRVFGAALNRCARSPFGFLEFRTAMEESGQAELDRLHRMTDGIGIIAAVGPMLGLLGTVFGMIGAFQTIGTLEGAARSTKLAEFMSLALINTAEGLMVAIPCTVAFAIFRRRIDRLGADASVIAEELAGLIEQSAGGEAQAPARPARPAAPAPARPAEPARGVQV